MKPSILIFQDFERLSRHAANLFLKQANRAVLERNRFLVALNGGSTPTRLFEMLASEYRDQIKWSSVHVFWGDERCIPPTEEGSNYRQAYDLVLSKVSIPASNIHRVQGERNPAAASKEYAETLKTFAEPPLEFPRLDLVYLGLGEDGHTASLFPDSPVQVHEPVVPVTARYQDRPAHRVTLTQMVFNQARAIVFMVSGEKKAGILAEVLGDRYNPAQYPAQRIEPKNGRLIWLLDEAAASKLPLRIKGSRFCEG